MLASIRRKDRQGLLASLALSSARRCTSPLAGPLTAARATTLERGRLPQPDKMGRLVQVAQQDGKLLLDFQSNNVSKTAILPKLWFRDACRCAHCVCQSSGQKRFSICDIDADPQLKSFKIIPSGGLELVWKNDSWANGNHTSTFSLGLLQRIVTEKGQPHWYNIPDRIFWDKALVDKNMRSLCISYREWMAGGESFVAALLKLIRWGLIFVKGVPGLVEAVQTIAGQMGDLQSTAYGVTWDVVSKPNAENVAYTNESLCLHQDLLYWMDTPKIQLLHCLENECQGGDSLFSDGLRSAWEMMHKDKTKYAVLADLSVPFHYEGNGSHYRKDRRVIETWGDDNIPQNINWSPPFQALFPLEMLEAKHTIRGQASSSLYAWRESAKAFRAAVESPENMLQCRLEPGDCVLFDNRRILHGRTGYDTSTGKRHLRGCYINSQTLQSLYIRMLKEGLVEPDPTPPHSAEAMQAEAMFSNR